MTSVLKMGGNESYGYDAVGNRTSSHLSATYTYQPFNRLTSTASATYTYDNNGDVLTKIDGSGMWTFGWDLENRLKQVTLPGSLTVNYKYDALGRRIRRTTRAGSDERFVYDGQDVLLDLDSSNTVATSYLNGPEVDDHLRQNNTATGVLYFLTDHLGSTSALTDPNGTVVEQFAYDSFGKNSGSTRTRYTYTGRERDPDTGLLYYHARWNDPVIGRFLSEDPMGLSPGPNPYEYAYDNPLRYVDPTGNQPWEVVFAGGGTLAGAGLSGAAASAAVPPVAVAAAGAAAIYGSSHLGEWIAAQPWNPLTRPVPFPGHPGPIAYNRCWANSSLIVRTSLLSSPKIEDHRVTV